MAPQEGSTPGVNKEVEAQIETLAGGIVPLKRMLFEVVQEYGITEPSQLMDILPLKVRPLES